MNKKKIILGIVVVICAVVLVFQIMGQERNRQEIEEPSPTIREEISSESDESGEKKKNVEQKDTSTKETNSTTKAEEETTKTDNTTTVEQENKKDSTKQDTDTTDIKVETVKFPYNISDKGITVKTLSGYDGLYVEDGSDETVKKVATILVKNNSKKAVEYGAITLQTDDDTLEFSFSTLPAGKSCIVMEKYKTTYNKKWKVQSLSGDFAYADEFSKLKSDISMETAKNNGITITNKTDSTIPRVRIFYKYQLESGEYVGGITYTCKVDDLEAGESRTIYPSHFSSDGSVIMMARRYEEKID